MIKTAKKGLTHLRTYIGTYCIVGAIEQEQEAFFML